MEFPSGFPTFWTHKSDKSRSFRHGSFKRKFRKKKKKVSTGKKGTCSSWQKWRRLGACVRDQRVWEPDSRQRWLGSAPFDARLRLGGNGSGPSKTGRPRCPPPLPYHCSSPVYIITVREKTCAATTRLLLYLTKFRPRRPGVCLWTTRPPAL